jgi:hypothetical protein
VVGVAARPTPAQQAPIAPERLRAEYEAYLFEQRGLTEKSGRPLTSHAIET